MDAVPWSEIDGERAAVDALVAVVDDGVAQHSARSLGTFYPR